MVTINDIADFWQRGEPVVEVRKALKAAGLEGQKLSVLDLAPLDHYHARGLKATVELADRLPVKPEHRLIDIGCGIGGPARYLADRFGCHVSGVDIAPKFIEIGNELCALTGTTDRVELRVGDGAKLPYEDASFDGAVSQHVTMNVADRAGFFAEAFRVLKPRGFLALSEHGAGPRGDPHYPLPWADDARFNFAKTREETEGFLHAAGFIEIETRDTGLRYIEAYRKVLAQKALGDGDPVASALGIHILVGESMAERTTNSVTNIEEGRSWPIEVVCFKSG